MRPVRTPQEFKACIGDQAVLAKIGTARNVPILGDVDFSALFAMQSQTSLGVAATKSVPLGENLAVFGGLAIRSLQEEGKDKIRFRGGIVAGAFCTAPARCRWSAACGRR